jgi:hypothetical protein
MEILSCDFAEKGGTPRDLIENMRKVGALVEILGLAMPLSTDQYDEQAAIELVHEAGGLVERLGVRALKLLDAQTAPPAPTPIRQPRVRSAKRRAA